MVATESYEEFAENLQKEIEADTGIRFGIVRPDEFATLLITSGDGEAVQLGEEQSRILFEHLNAEGYIDRRGHIQDTLRTALQKGALFVPPEFEAHLAQIAQLVSKLAGRLDIKNADERRTIRPRKEVLYSPEFKDLWDRIKHKTTYRVDFDNEKLIADCVEDLSPPKWQPIPSTRLRWTKADITIGEAGITAAEQKRGTDIVALQESGIELPDLLTDLQNRTQLTRRSLYKILTESGQLADFKRNPQLFMDRAATIINLRKQLALVDGIKYHRLADSQYYAQELFEADELTGYLKNMLEHTQKSVMESVLFDSLVEKGFAKDLEAHDRIKLYTKLPRDFTIPTPLGSYNPDWAIVAATPDGDKLYFVVETKGGLDLGDLRDPESAKIKCGKAHFAALADGPNPARFKPATSVDMIFT